MSISGFRLLGQGIWPTLKKDQGRLFPGADRPGQARLCRAMAVGLKTSGHEAQGPWAHGSFITHETRGNASAEEITEEWGGAEMAKARERNIEVKYFLGGQFWGMV